MFALKYRISFAVFVIAGALFLVLPTLSPSLSISPNTGIHLGLDLKGGVQLTLGVDTPVSLQTTLTSTGQMLRQKAQEQGIVILGPRMLSDGTQELLLPQKEYLEKVLFLIHENAPQLVIATPRTDVDGTIHLPVSFTSTYAKQTEELTVEQVIQTISNRIDQFGVTEPDIRKQESNRILLQLPGLTDVQRAVQLVGQSAHLSFHLVRDDILPGAFLPPGVASYPFQAKTQEGGILFLDKAPLFSGKEIADARPGFDEKGNALVSVSFTAHGAHLFQIITEEYMKSRLAIVVDGVVHSAPVIQNKITGGAATITGYFSPEEAQDLAISLRSGSLAAPVHVLEERTVGPALGEASIISGVLAAFIGTLAVMIIMPLRYGWCGMLANGMLLCTLLILMGGMAAMGATLTLPGIAGIVLTIGMAVDANVLIFERIREELSLGVPTLHAIKAGFERANLSITDSNLTTILVAALLYHFGTGPVKGFAVTLILGIFASMFTALFLSRIVLDAWINLKSGTQFSIHGFMELRLISRFLSHYPFLKQVPYVAGFTFFLIAAALTVGIWRGGLQYGVDFAGGVAAQTRFEQPIEDTFIREILAPLNLENLLMQQYGDDGKVWLIRFALPDMPIHELGKHLKVAFQSGMDGGKVIFDRLESVGPKVGDKLKSSAIEAIYYALLLITVYISGRFEHQWGKAMLIAGALTGAMVGLQAIGIPIEWRIWAALLLTLTLCWRFRLAFAAGAMVSLLFDVAATTSLLILLGQEIDLNIVAALLTIIGYSLNDTIVIYDRIREKLRYENNETLRPLPLIIQEALGETMSRTLLTAGTTLVAALALFLLGGPVIHGFALTMLIGVFMGTLSSLFVAAPLLPLFGDTASFKTAVTPYVFAKPGEHGMI